VELELQWLAKVIRTAITLFLASTEKVGEEGRDSENSQLVETRSLSPPVLPESSYRSFIREHKMGFDERLVLILAVAAYVRPAALDLFLIRDKTLDRGFSEFGGVSQPAGFWPTVKTAAFLLSGGELDVRFRVQYIFDSQYFFIVQKVLKIDANDGAESTFNTPLELHSEYLNLLTTGQKVQPAFSINFPARPLTTFKEWHDLVLPTQTLGDLEEVKFWLEHRDTLLADWQLSQHVNAGYQALFYGPPGTGKTLTAALLGKVAGLPVYRVDLSLIVSKWIGEAEKNLSAVFEQAENNDWILYFDEADALFGKRTLDATANDRHANHVASYLLQRIEGFSGLFIFSSHSKALIDDTFVRRFQSLIMFDVPKQQERRKLWQTLLAPPFQFASDVDLDRLASEYEIAGGNMVNVLRYASLTALRQKTEIIQLADLQEGMRRELAKLGWMG